MLSPLCVKKKSILYLGSEIVSSNIIERKGKIKFIGIKNRDFVFLTRTF